MAEQIASPSLVKINYKTPKIFVRPVKCGGFVTDFNQCQQTAQEQFNGNVPRTAEAEVNSDYCKEGNTVTQQHNSKKNILVTSDGGDPKSSNVNLPNADLINTGSVPNRIFNDIQKLAKTIDATSQMAQIIANPLLVVKTPLVSSYSCTSS